MQKEANQTNIQKADEVAGRLGQLGIIPLGKISPYTGFLSSTPATLTSFAVLLDKIDDGTATRNDYVHTLTSLGSTSFGVTNLVRIGLSLNPYGLGISLGVAVTLAAIEYLDSKDYNWDKIKEDAGISVDWNDLINFRDELLVKYGLKDVDFEKYISTQENKKLDFKDSFLDNKLNPSEVEAKLEDIKNQLQNYLEKISNKETELKIQLTEQEIKDGVYKKVREYVHENGITSFQDIGQFIGKVREELKNGTINIENKEQNLKEEIQEEPKEENHSSQVYRR